MDRSPFEFGIVAFIVCRFLHTTASTNNNLNQQLPAILMCGQKIYWSRHRHLRRVPVDSRARNVINQCSS